MLNFLKKFFAKEEIPEEKIGLKDLAAWLDNKSKPMIEGLNSNINKIIGKINDEKALVSENLKKLENAQLQNPKIPERVKTIMQGNREAFIKKTSYFFDNLNIKLDNENNYKELIKKCKDIENEIELLGKATAKSFQVLNEFFAREAERVAINIKNIERYSKEIINSTNNSKILNIDKIKDNIANIKNKIRLKEEYSKELEDIKNNLESLKNKKIEFESKINKIKVSEEYKNYEKLLEERKNIEEKLNNIENKLFHDFSVLERALKKYSKIAFENENLIVEYLSSPIKALIMDKELKINKILNDIEKSIVGNSLELDTKKSEKTLSKIKELGGDYFSSNKNNLENLNEKLGKIKSEIKNNKAKNELDNCNNELGKIELDIENLNNNISTIGGELEKINIEKLKEKLQKDINETINAKVIVH